MIDIKDMVRYFHSIGAISRFKLSINNAQITCPFPHHSKGGIHFEENPSLGIHYETGVWNCFGCGKRGIIDELVAEWLSVNIYEATQWITSRYILDEQGFRKTERLKLFDLPNYEALFGSKVYMDTFEEEYFSPFRKIHPYTLERGFT